MRRSRKRNASQRGVAPFAEIFALVDVPFEAHCTPAMEIGWRLAAEQWGRGYATSCSPKASTGGGASTTLAPVVPDL